MRSRSDSSALGRIVPLVIILAILGVVGWIALQRGPAPQIAIEPATKVIGRVTPVTVRVSEPQRGLSSVSVEFVQGELVKQIAAPAYEAPPAWAFWRSGKTADELRMTVGKDALPGLKTGTAIVRATANGIPGLARGAASATSQVELPVQLTPPSLQVMSIRTYVAQGGVEAVVYRVGETAVRDGVRVGDRLFPGYALPGGGAQDRFALFAVPYDLSDPSGIRLVADDGAGNESQVRFIDQFFPKPLRTDKIQLNDAFLEKVTSEILAQTPELTNKGNPLDNYLEINRALRKQNQAVLEELASRSEKAFLWREPFLPMINTAIKAHFAERRSYLYQGREVDQQDHLGLDMASVRAAPVPATNDGVVVFAAYLGIYGNCVVLDHGYGLQSLYGHLSSIDVKVGDKVTRGQALGRSGATGLAAGDHLHFGMMLQGLAVSPIEWFDRKWINDRLKLKLGAALPFGHE
jgi:murein DD-endopeptidase MepM/ murein hydrolase activator NlpD